MSRTSERLAETLEEAIREWISNDTLSEDCVNDMISDHMRDMEVEADNVDGLERFIENCVDGRSVDAGDVDGLDEFVKNEFDALFRETATTEGIDELINGHLDATLKDRVLKVLEENQTAFQPGHVENMEKALLDALNDPSPELKLAIDKTIRNSMGRVMKDLLAWLPTLVAGEVLVAEPLKKDSPPIVVEPTPEPTDEFNFQSL